MATTFVHYTPAQNVTAKASAAVTAGTFVQIAATVDGRNPVIKPAAAGAAAFGVPAHDCVKDGYVMVYRSGHIVDVAATGAISAGDPVAVGANGTAVKQADDATIVGTAVSTATDKVVQVALA